MERAHLESEIQQVPPPLLGHPSAGVLSSRGWGWVDSPALLRESQSPSPFPTTRSSPARPRLPCFPGPWREGGGGGGGRGTLRGRYTRGDRSKTPPPHIRESILSLPSTPACRHAYARPFSPEDGYRNSLPALRDPRGTYDGRRVAAAVAAAGGLIAKGFDTGVFQEALIRPTSTTSASNAITVLLILGCAREHDVFCTSCSWRVRP